MALDLENKVQELQDIITDVRIEQAKQGGDVKDLLGWRDQFQKDIKDSLSKLDGKMDRELAEMGNNIKNLNEKMDAQNKELHQKIDSNNTVVLQKLEENSKDQANALQKMQSKLPLWAQVVYSIFVIIAGWAIMILYYTLKK